MGCLAITTSALSVSFPGSAAGTVTARLAAGSASVGSGNITEPVNVVIAVDESGSIRPSEMAEERNAARLVALGEFAPNSKVGILGFGGADSLESASNPQPPVDQVCPMTEVNSSAARQGLSDCIDKLHVRTQAQGWNTDFISAINQAVSELTGTTDTGHPLLMFLLTDGHLDLYGDPAYSGNKQQVDAAAQSNLVNQVLPAAAKAGVSIWPLGFGSDVDINELQQIAAGGAQGSCSKLPNATPRAITVASSAQVERTLQQIYANARCLRLSPGGNGSVGGNGSLNLSVTVPVIATEGVIEVIRQLPQVQVKIYDPRGNQVPTQGTFDGSTFQLGGENGPVEALTVTDPLPGVWRIHFQAPAGVPSVDVNASVLWQGILHSDIVVNPPQPRPGQTVTLMVRLQVRGEVLTDPAALAGVSVQAQVTGAGFRTPLTANLASPDPSAGGGTYTGQLTIPKEATGELTFTTSVTGQGVTGDKRLFTTQIAGPLSVGAQINVPAVRVAPGGRVEGTITVSNPTGAAHTLRLILPGAPPGVTVSPATVQVSAASGNTLWRFGIRIQPSVPQQVIAGTLEAVDPAQPGLVFGQAFYTITVAVPPHWYQEWWIWVLVTLFVVGVALAAYALLRSRIARASMEQIEIVLFDGGSEIDALQAPAGCGSRFPFSIDRSRSGLPRLEVDLSGASEFVTRRWPGGRRGLGGIMLTGPGSEVQKLSQQGAPAAALGDGTALGFRDLRMAEPLPEDPWLAGIADEDPDSPHPNGHRQRRWFRRRTADLPGLPDEEDLP